jgi:oligopeptide transport system permease protein
VIAFLGPAFAGLLAGSFVVETIFQIPGLGRFYVQAAFNRDYTMILGTTVFLSSLIVFFNLVSDIIAAWLNPRLRHQLSGSGS